jgi:integrase/recombinase XerD
MADDALDGILVPEGATELQEVKATQAWLEAAELFLNSLRSPKTREAYRYALKDLLGFTGKQPWLITRADVQRWVDQMRERELAAATINQRVSGASSFFEFIRSEFNLIDHNPASSKSLRARSQAYRSASYLTPDQAAKLLKVIDRYTDQGRQDYALFMFYIFTGRRNSEIRQLTWGDLDHKGGTIRYHWIGKGKERWDELPAPVYQALVQYLQNLPGRWPPHPTDYLFTPLTDAAANLPTVDQESWTGQQPITKAEIGRRLKKYAAAAGLDPQQIHPHSLRHTAAMLRRQAGDDIESISHFLNHANISTTQIYLHSLEGQQDESWPEVARQLGIKK